MVIERNAVSYLSLNGVEIVNSERMRLALDDAATNHAFSLAVNNCGHCDELEDLLQLPITEGGLNDNGAGGTVRPATDLTRPWGDPYDAADGTFFDNHNNLFVGFMATDIEFSESYSRTFATNANGGLIAAQPTNKGRDILVTGYLLGLSEDGANFGLSWLRDVLALDDPTASGCSPLSSSFTFLRHCRCATDLFPRTDWFGELQGVATKTMPVILDELAADSNNPNNCAASNCTGGHAIEVQFQLTDTVGTTFSPPLAVAGLPADDADGWTQFNCATTECQLNCCDSPVSSSVLPSAFSMLANNPICLPPLRTCPYCFELGDVASGTYPIIQLQARGDTVYGTEIKLKRKTVEGQVCCGADSCTDDLCGVDIHMVIPELETGNTLAIDFRTNTSTLYKPGCVTESARGLVFNGQTGGRMNLTPLECGDWCAYVTVSALDTECTDLWFAVDTAVGEQ